MFKILNGFFRLKLPIYSRSTYGKSFIIVFFFVWMAMFPVLPLTGYISQLIRVAQVSSHVTDFDARNKLLTA